jgi:hypothetical protein
MQLKAAKRFCENISVLNLLSVLCTVEIMVIESTFRRKQIRKKGENVIKYYQNID